jgi:DnaJ family protein A protein 2
MSDLYALLGLEKGAGEAEIRKAYKKQALSKHPDRGGDKEEFQKMHAAYEVLSDPGKRAHYDATGQMPGSDGGGGTGGPGGMPDLSEIFGQMFGGGMPFGMGGMGSMGGPGGIPIPIFMGGAGGIPAKAARGPNKIHEIGVSLRELYAGKTVKLKMKRDVICSTCNGKGGENTEACGTCRGSGMRVRRQQMGPMTAMTQGPCDECQATGQKVLRKCDDCTGRRVVERESILDVEIKPGMQEGDRLVFPGQCSESPMFEAPGDVILVIRAAAGDKEGEQWTRRGSDLALEVELSLPEALLGWERTFASHPSGRPLHLIWQGDALRDGEVLRVPGWGMPLTGNPLTGNPLTGNPLTGNPLTDGGHGDLRVVCRITGGQVAWSEEQRKALCTVWPEWNQPVATESSVLLKQSERP